MPEVSKFYRVNKEAVNTGKVADSKLLDTLTKELET